MIHVLAVALVAIALVSQASAATFQVPAGNVASFRQAVATAADGDRIELAAGTYVYDSADDFVQSPATITKRLTIIGVGGMARLNVTAPAPNGKGLFVVNSPDIRFESIEVSGVTVADGNGAAIRFEGGTLTLEKVFFHDNQNGLLAAAAPAGKININLSEFARNGGRGGSNHGIYVNQIAEVSVTQSWFHDTNEGHHIKSRAAVTKVIGNRLDDGARNSSYSVDIPNGGQATVSQNNIVQGANAGNSALIHFGGEAPAPAGSFLIVDGNMLQNLRDGPAIGVLNHTPVVAQVTNNQRFRLTTTVDGPGSCSGNTNLPALVPVDQTAPWGNGGAVPPPPPPPPPGGCE